MICFKTVTFKGTALTANQRQAVQLNKAMRERHNPDHLRNQVDLALRQLDKHKESGKKPYKTWTVIKSEKGTPYLGDCFVF